MASNIDQKPKTGAGSESDQSGRGSSQPDFRVTRSNLSSNRIIAYIIAALVLIFGAFLLFTNYWSTTTTVPTATQESTTPPAPDAIAPVTPVPTAPPAPDTTTPPATGTAPQPPVAPAQ